MAIKTFRDAVITQDDYAFTIPPRRKPRELELVQNCEEDSLHRSSSTVLLAIPGDVAVGPEGGERASCGVELFEW